jgi:hypothetical protein
MNCAKLITESEEELKQIENRQKLAPLQKPIHFLRLLKSQPASPQQAVGQGVAWQLRQRQKIGVIEQ